MLLGDHVQKISHISETPLKPPATFDEEDYEYSRISSINLGGRNLTFLKTAFFFKNHYEFLVFRRREDFYFLLEIFIQKTILKKLLVFGSLT